MNWSIISLFAIYAAVGILTLIVWWLITVGCSTALLLSVWLADPVAFLLSLLALTLYSCQDSYGLIKAIHQQAVTHWRSGESS